MFENKIIEGIHISRFIASWEKAGGNCRKDRELFREWLETLVINGRRLADDEIHDILFLAGNGKLELELSAKAFIKENK